MCVPCASGLANVLVVVVAGCCCHMIHKQSRETLMVNTLEPDLGRSGAYKWPMTQLAIIRAFSPYLLRSPKMVDSGSAYRYQSKTYDFLLYIYHISTHISDSVAHLWLILFAIRAWPAQWAISRQIARLIADSAWPVDWTGLDAYGSIDGLCYSCWPRYGYGLNDCKTSLSFVAARLGYWYNYEV